MRVCELMVNKGFGGAERAFVDTALAIADAGHAVQAICHQDFVKRQLLEDHPRILVTPVALYGQIDPFATSRIRKALGVFGPDVIHCHLSRGASLAGHAGKQMGIPVVANLHNTINLKYYANVSGFIATTQDQYNNLISRGVPASRATILPNFSRSPVKHPLNLQPVANAARPIRLVTCGRLHPVKGYDVLLKAIRLLIDKGLRVQLNIGGDGAELPALQRLRSQLRLDQDVEFSGWVDDTSRFLDEGDLYVLSSRSESFGISMLEAMSRGLPVVTTRCQGPSQILTDDQAWFATPGDPVSLANAIEQAIANPAQRSERGQLLQQLYIDKYREESVIPKAVEFFKLCGATDTGGWSENAVWPDQYVDTTPLQIAERGTSRMLVHQDYAPEFARRGWHSCEDVLNTEDVEVLRRTDERDNCRVVLEDQGKTTTAFLKRHHERPQFRLFRPKQLLSGWIEAEAVGLCDRTGIRTMKVLASGYEKAARTESGSPCVASFSLTRAAGEVTGFELINAMHEGDRFDAPEHVRIRKGLILAAAALTRRMHQAGLRHQDLFWHHLFFEEAGPGVFSARVIDVQRLIRPNSSFARAYFWIKDMEQMRFSFQKMRVTEIDIADWYQAYFCRNPLSLWQRFLTGVIWLRGAKRSLRLAKNIRNGTYPPQQKT